MISMKQLIFLLLLIPTLALARPVSYVGGTTLMVENDGEKNAALLHYTVSPNLAVGYRTEYLRHHNATFNGAQANWLVKRWNAPNSQANIYVKSALGYTHGNGDRSDNIEGFTGLAADWENRRFMVGYENRAWLSGNAARQHLEQDAMIGVAPYVAEFGALHSWAMLHIKHVPEDEAGDQVQFVPQMRFFQGPYLLEAGYNITNDTPVLNGIIRF